MLLFEFSVDVGAFVIGLSQISSFFSNRFIGFNHPTYRNSNVISPNIYSILVKRQNDTDVILLQY